MIQKQFSKTIREHYEGKTVAVLGGAGFVGQHLCLALLELGATVIVFDDLSRGRTLVTGALFRRVDVSRNHQFLGERFGLLGIDTVFNLAAAVAGVHHNQGNHLQMYDDNIRVLTAPLRAAEVAGVGRFLQVSSVCVYAKDFNAPASESLDAGLVESPVQANIGYSEAKRDGERAAFWSSIPRVVVVRPSNVAGGPGDYYDSKAHVVPALVRRAIECKETGDRFVIKGDPHAKREFVHPVDVAQGMIYALARGTDRKAYNIGTSAATMVTIQELAGRILTRLGMGGHRMSVDKSLDSGDSVRWSDGSRLRALGWAHTLGIDEMISDAVDGYKV